MTLPVPRDARERDAMLWAFGKGAAGNDRYVAIGELNRAADHAIPPVGEPMVELAKPWAVFGAGDGSLIMTDSRDEALDRAPRWDRVHPKSAPHRVVRLAIVEVIEPTPPDSWERLAKDVTDRPRGEWNPEMWAGFLARRAALLAGRGE